MTRLSEQDFDAILNGNPDLHVAGLEPGPARRKTPTGPKAPVPTEHQEQVALVQWAAANVSRWPELRLLAAIPNGGARNIQTAALLKAEGVQSGFPDLILCTQRRGPDGRNYGALFLELKRADHSNPPSPMQKVWLDALKSEGYMCIVAYGADEAIAAIEHYLNLGR